MYLQKVNSKKRKEKKRWDEISLTCVGTTDICKYICIIYIKMNTFQSNVTMSTKSGLRSDLRTIACFSNTIMTVHPCGYFRWAHSTEKSLFQLQFQRAILIRDTSFSLHSSDTRTTNRSIAHLHVLWFL